MGKTGGFGSVMRPFKISTTGYLREDAAAGSFGDTTAAAAALLCPHPMVTLLLAFYHCFFYENDKARLHRMDGTKRSRRQLLLSPLFDEKSRLEKGFLLCFASPFWLVWVCRCFS